MDFILSFQSALREGVVGEEKDEHIWYRKCHKKNMFWQTFPNLWLQRIYIIQVYYKCRG